VASVFEKSNFKHIKATTVRTMETMETVEDVSTVPSEVNEGALEPRRGAWSAPRTDRVEIEKLLRWKYQYELFDTVCSIRVFWKCGVTILHWNA
jgi:hypothetical protein